MQPIYPFLWFDHEAEEAATFYVSVFPNSRINGVVRYGPHGPGKAGSVMTVDFEVNGARLAALNGGPVHRFTEAVSLVVNCDSAAEVDSVWAALTANGGQPGRCGWCKDRWGLSWQVVPVRLLELLQDREPGRAQRTMAAMLQMDKLDVAALEAAAAG